MTGQKVCFLYTFFYFSMVAVGCSNNININDITEEDYYEEPYLESNTEISTEDFGSEENIAEGNKKYSEKNFYYREDFGDDIPVSRAVVAKMIALSFSSEEEILKSERKINFSDSDITKWYDKYINLTFIKGFMSGAGNGQNFLPEEFLSVTQAQFLADRLDKNNKIKIRLDSENKDKPISLALWNEIFIKVLENLSENSDYCQKFGISQKEAVVIATENNNNMLKNNYIITDSGLFKCEGFDVSYYTDKKISFLAKGDKIITVLSVMNDLHNMNDIYILNGDENGLKIFAGGAEKEYLFDEDFVGNKTENMSNKIADLVIKDGKVIDVISNENYFEGSIKSFDNTGIEMEGGEKQFFSKDLKIYLINNSNILWGNLDDIKVSQKGRCYVKNEKISAVVIM